MTTTHRHLGSRPSTDVARRRARRSIALPLAAAALLALSGCVTDGAGTTDGTPSASELNRMAREAMTGSGNVQVQLLEGTAYVTGNLESATDQRSIERALLDADGVERVQMSVRREM